jgi:DivIVA domain-containing protein
VLTVLAVLAVLAVLFAAGALITHEGDVLRDAPADAPDLDLPIGPLQPEDVPQLRFGLALRGYRMDEVDTTLVRVARELTVRDQHIAQLQQALASQVAAVEPAPETAAQPEPEQAAQPEPETAPQPEPETAAWPEQDWPQTDWPQTDWPQQPSTSAVAESHEQLHAPTPELVEDLFPEISPPEPDVEGLPDATENEAAPVSSFGLFDHPFDAPLGEPGVGFAASGGGATDVVRDSAP